MRRSITSALIAMGALTFSATLGCASPAVFTGITAVDVTLVAHDDSRSATRTIDAKELGTWAVCLEETRATDGSHILKAVFDEGEYVLNITDAAGTRTFSLDNTEDMTDSATAFYKNTCLFDLVTAAVK